MTRSITAELLVSLPGKTTLVLFGSSRVGLAGCSSEQVSRSCRSSRFAWQLRKQLVLVFHISRISYILLPCTV